MVFLKIVYRKYIGLSSIEWNLTTFKQIQKKKKKKKKKTYTAWQEIQFF